MKMKTDKPIPSKDLTVEEIEAANEIKRLIPQAIVRWPKGFQNQAVIFPIGDSDQQTEEIERRLEPLLRQPLAEPKRRAADTTPAAPVLSKQQLRKLQQKQKEEQLQREKEKWARAEIRKR